MGAWGFALFQSDTDFDLISDLTGECGLYDIEEDLQKRAETDQAVRAKYARAMRPRSKANLSNEDHPDYYISFSISADLCSTEAVVVMVREHLEAGALAKLIEHYDGKLSDEAGGGRGYMGKGYYYVLLGACTMTLGCKLSETFKQGLKDKYKHVGLMDVARKQMKKALFGPNGYVEGSPYTFDESLGLVETCNQLPAEEPSTPTLGNFDLLNVVEPGSMFDTRVKQDFGRNVCAACGDTEQDDGSKLLSCGKCKAQKYCSRVCQKMHWKKHKNVCKPPAF